MASVRPALCTTRFLPAILLFLALLSCRAENEDALFRQLTFSESGIDFENRLVEDDSVYNPLNTGPDGNEIPRFESDAQATLETTLTEGERSRAHVSRAPHFASSYIENLGEGRFRHRPLPMSAQFSPVLGSLPRDFDGDGHLDALLVGNSHATESQSGWYDAAMYALVTLADGSVRREEFHHGSGHLSQSSRMLEVPLDVRAVQLFDRHGADRVEEVPPLLEES